MISKYWISETGLIRLVIVILLALFAFPHFCIAGQHKQNQGPEGPPTGWSTSVRGGYASRGDTDLEGDGSFSSHNALVETDVRYALDQMALSFSLGYGRYSFDFSGDTGMANLTPWDDIHSVRFGAALTWRLNPQSTLMVAPSLSMYAENGADKDEALTLGLMMGYFYRFSDRLTIGPGIGVFNQIEDESLFLPMLLIHWKITDKLSFDTGGGLGVTLGPGLGFNYRLSDNLHLSLGCRFEKLRFRLNDDETAKNGVGEDSSTGLYGSASYQFNPMVKISLYAGTYLDGVLRLEDETGELINEEDYDTAPFAGFSIDIRF